ncbi:hypothetical protein GCM10018987_08790 [Streptomyces cremeus]
MRSSWEICKRVWNGDWPGSGCRVVVMKYEKCSARQSRRSAASEEASRRSPPVNGSA